MSEKQEVKDRELNESPKNTPEEEPQDQGSQEEQVEDKAQGPEEKDQSSAQSAEQKGEGEKDKDDLEEIKGELADLKNQNLRLYADFENFRKRTAKERMELYSTANQELMEALLPVLDDFRRALKAQDDEKSGEGVKLIYNKFENILKNKGLKPMEESTGKEFDVDTMEAITRIPAAEDDQKGKVIDEVERGYFLGNKILRYAKVVVGE